MTLLRLGNVSKSYGATPVLKDICWQIEESQRIGLIGRNGSGKTTLFKLMAGELLPDKGQVHRAKGAQIGLLTQEPRLEEGATLFGTMRASFGHLVSMHDQLRALQERIARTGNAQDALDEYGALHERYEREGGYTFETQIKAALQGLGFKDQDLDQPIARFSGGEKSRVALAQLLVKRPSLLLLDEPTNHLDLAGIEWLEGYLESYQGSVILVSHDRYLLDRLVGDIVEIEALALARYPGCNYSAYAVEKEKRTGKQQKLYDQQQAEIARLEEFIRRNIAGQKTKQAQSRRKVLGRLERTERPVQTRQVELRLIAQERGGNDVLCAEDLSKAYQSKALFADLSFVLRRKERVGILGPNGSGKTSLLKILIGAEAPDAGRVRMGRNIQAGYYDQALEGLDKDKAILDEVWQLDPSATREQMRTFLGRFLFSGDEVFRPIRSLSGGEQSRVALAKLMLSGANLLVLDEPTNHLDIPSRIALEEALAQYQGSLVVVSHDRYFLDKIAQRILYLRDGAAKMYEGNYSDFQRKRNNQDQQPASATPKKVSTHQVAYQERKQEDRTRRRLERRFREIENEIMTVEDEIARTDDLLTSKELNLDWARLDELTRQKQRLRAILERLYEDWARMEARV